MSGEPNMPIFEIAWPRKHVEWRVRPREHWFVEAVLLERKLVNGRPQMRWAVGWLLSHWMGATAARDRQRSPRQNGRRPGHANGPDPQG